jgi:hypothetical protein
MGDVKPDSDQDPQVAATGEVEVSHSSVKVELKDQDYSITWTSLSISNIVPYLEKDPKNLESFNDFVAAQLVSKTRVGDNIIPMSADDVHQNQYDT